MSQHVAQGFERLLSYQRNECGIDSIVHHRCLCWIGKLSRWSSGYNPGNTHTCHDFPTSHVSYNLTWPPSIRPFGHAALCCQGCCFNELFVSCCKFLSELFFSSHGNLSPFRSSGF